MVALRAGTLLFLILIVNTHKVHSQRTSKDSSKNVELIVKGFIPPAFTPVDGKGNLNVRVVPKYAKFLKDQGMDGVLLSGTAGEGDKFSVKEKMRLLDAWLEAARPLGLTVMLQVAAIPLPDAKQLARYAEQKGVDGILALPELYYKPTTVEELVYYLHCLANCAPNTPILYYHIPAFTNVFLDMGQLMEQATRKIPTFKGIKVGVFGSALQVRTKVENDQRIFLSNSTFLAPGAMMGFDNLIMTELNLFPELCKQIFEESQNCNQKMARRNYEKLQAYKRAIVAQGRPLYPAQKEAMRLLTGINVGPIREPTMPLTDKQKTELAVSLKRIGLKLKV